MDCRICSICKSQLSVGFLVHGVKNLWGKDISKSEYYRFSQCPGCGYTLNEDYEEIDFLDEDYSNHTIVSTADDRERILADKLLYYVGICNRQKDLTRYLEVGSGRRLGLLKAIKEKSIGSRFIAIDSTYGTSQIEVLSRDHEIDFMGSASCVKAEDCFSVLILRNSIEYMSPDALSELFKTIVGQKGILLLEQTILDTERQGYGHCYTEYGYFYTLENIKSILTRSGLQPLELESGRVYGDDRLLSFVWLWEKDKEQKRRLFSDMNSLAMFLEETIENVGLKAIMFGWGGRNVMALANDLRGLVEGIYESDTERSRGVKLPEGTQFVEPSLVDVGCPIVLLNSRFLTEAERLFPGNTILLLN